MSYEFKNPVAAKKLNLLPVVLCCRIFFKLTK